MCPVVNVEKPSRSPPKTWCLGSQNSCFSWFLGLEVPQLSTGGISGPEVEAEWCNEVSS